MKKNTLVLVLGIIFIVALLVTAYFMLFYKSSVTITSQPNSAQIDLSGTSGIGKIQAKFKPGTYNLKVDLENYVPLEKSLVIKASQKMSIDIVLRKQSEPVKLVDYPAKFVTTTPDGKSLLYLSNQGRTIYKIEGILSAIKQKPYAVTPAVFQDVEDILWQPKKELAIVKQKTKYFLYDFGRYDLLNQELIPLPDGIISPVWSPDGEKIVYFNHPNNEPKTLIRASKNNTQKEIIFDFKNTSITNPRLRWSPDGQKILLLDDQTYIFDVYTKEIKQLAQFESIYDASFTPNSQNIIYEKEGKLYTIDLGGGDRQDLNLAMPLNKIAWFDEDNLLYFKENNKTDSIAKYNIYTKAKIDYTYNPNFVIRGSYPIISIDNQKVFYLQGDDLNALNLVNKGYD